MSNPTIIVATISLLGAILTAILGYYFGQQKMVSEYKRELTTNIWEKRCEYYTQLTGKMQKVPRWPSEQGNLKYKDLLELSHDFKNWYFNGGGLFLSQDSREAYGNVQKFIADTLLNQVFDASNTKLQQVVSIEDYKKAIGHLSGLRKKLTTDLLSREQDIFLEKE